jgi:polyisoprenoid-binding protein YceI
VIQAASIDTGIADRDAHLRTADFFDVEKHPEIRFESKRIEKRPDQLIAHGILTIRGIANPVSLPVAIHGLRKEAGTASIGLSTSATIDRQQYGVSWTREDIPDFVGDEVEIEIHLLSKLNPIEPAE